MVESNGGKHPMLTSGLHMHSPTYTKAHTNRYIQCTQKPLSPGLRKNSCLKL
ncbi:hypothetical protein I79_023830 [Cricetulus griseus]|uniref:Uncharacterized protein n=1 Tax=Cricetulus griseus TaxID=10029 RepID=G3IJ00_CRIGR|nr:hypothetical protein I79_023830 [Cricetulus griseus]